MNNKQDWRYQALDNAIDRAASITDELAYIEREAREQGEADALTETRLFDQAASLVVTLEEEINDLCGDWQAEGAFSPAASAHHRRLCHALTRAIRRLERRGGTDPMEAR